MSPIPANKAPDTVPEQSHEVFRDLVTGCLSVGAASLLAISHFGQGGRLHADYGSEPGPALLPELLLAVLGTAGVVLILRGALSRRAGSTKRAALIARSAVMAIVPISKASLAGHFSFLASRSPLVFFRRCLALALQLPHWAQCCAPHWPCVKAGRCCDLPPRVSPLLPCSTASSGMCCRSR